MNNFWLNLLIELGIFSFLGFLYYLYQKRKIEQYELEKVPMTISYILQSCLSEKNEEINNPELDSLILELDNYLQNKISSPPLQKIKEYSSSHYCSRELADIMREGLVEIESANEAK